MRRPCSTRAVCGRPTSTATRSAASSRSRSRVRRPDLVRSLVLVGTGPGGPDHEPLPPETWETWLSVVGLPLEEAIRRTMPTSFAPGWIDAHPDEYESYLAGAARSPDAARVLVGAARGGAAPTSSTVLRWSGSMRPRSSSTASSTASFPVANGRLLAERMPHAELVVLPGAATCRCSSRRPSSPPSRAPFSTDLTHFQCLALRRNNCVPVDPQSSRAGAQAERDGRYWAYSSSIVVSRVRVWSASSGA